MRKSNVHEGELFGCRTKVILLIHIYTIVIFYCRQTKYWTINQRKDIKKTYDFERDRS